MPGNTYHHRNHLQLEDVEWEIEERYWRKERTAWVVPTEGHGPDARSPRPSQSEKQEGIYRD
jgi:hypothetical protein